MPAADRGALGCNRAVIKLSCFAEKGNSSLGRENAKVVDLYWNQLCF